MGREFAVSTQADASPLTALLLCHRTLRPVANQRALLAHTEFKDPEAATSVLRAAEIQVFEPGPRGRRPRTYFTTHGSSACTGFLDHQ